MLLRAYWLSLTKMHREAFAAACGTSVGYFNNLIGETNFKAWMGGDANAKRPSAELCIEIEKHSRRLVSCEELRDDIDWAVLRVRHTKVPGRRSTDHDFSAAPG